MKLRLQFNKSKRTKIKRYAPAALVIALAVGVGGYSSTKAQAATTPQPCVFQYVASSSKVSSFINAYFNGSWARIVMYKRCGGSPVWTDYFTQYTLTTNHKKLTDSQFSYWDGNPPGPTTTKTCTLTKLSATSARIYCQGTTLILKPAQ